MIALRRQKAVWTTLAAMGLLSTSCMFGRPAAAEPPLQLETLQTPIVEQVVFTVERGNVSENLIFEGQILLTEQEELFFGKTGRVQSVNTESGDRVEAGALIAEIETRDVTYDLEEAALALTLAENRLGKAKSARDYLLQDAELDLEIARLRLRSYEERDDVDSAELEIRRREVEQAELTLERISGGVGVVLANDFDQLQTDIALADLKVKRLEASLVESQVIAPFSGEVRLYETLVEGKAVTAYQPVAVVVNPDSYQITANLVREDLELLAEGMPVQLQLSYQNDAWIAGKLVRLPQPFGSGVGTQTIIEAENEADSDLLRAGASVTVMVELNKSEDTLWLEPDAILGFGADRYVLVNDQGVNREVAIELGLSNAEQVEIVRGVTEGMKVLGQ